MTWKIPYSWQALSKTWMPMGNMLSLPMKAHLWGCDYTKSIFKILYLWPVTMNLPSELGTWVLHETHHHIKVNKCAKVFQNPSRHGEVMAWTSLASNFWLLTWHCDLALWARNLSLTHDTLFHQDTHMCQNISKSFQAREIMARTSQSRWTGAHIYIHLTTPNWGADYV